MDTVTLIHFGELTLKGKNRSLFEEILKENIESVTGGSIKKCRGYFVLSGGDVSGLKRVFGISWYATAKTVERDMGSIKDKVLSEIPATDNGEATFGVFVKRSDKDYPLKSYEAASLIGQAVSDSYGLPVDLDRPDIPVFVEITPGEAFVFFDKHEGLKGLPVGVSGKVLTLLSGGIDSPVASYLIMKRGCRTDYIHFHVFSDNEKLRDTKMYELLETLSLYSSGSSVYMVPYYPFEMKLLEHSLIKGHELILFRRFMLRVAERLAVKGRHKALVTGDSIGQVASQTLDNLAQAHNAVKLPLLQPLLAYDKQEIVDLAKTIGTYDISIRQYKDCCSIVSRTPKTRSRQAEVLKLERLLNIDELVNHTVGLVSEVKI